MADQANKHWELDFENVGDPHQEISKTSSERGWLTLYANRSDIAFLQRGADWDIEHPKGFFQPGVLALTNKRRVLYRWRSVPSQENLNGTAMRPTARHVWNQIEASLAEKDAVEDARHDDNPETDRAPPPRIIFFAALIANGWFLRAKSFMYSPGAEPIPSRFKAVFSRWFLFLLFWIIALFIAPSTLVGIAFVGWLGWIVWDLKRIMNEMDDQVELKAGR